MVCGVGHERLLRSSDRTERLVEAMLTDRVTERLEHLEDQRITKMANAIAQVLGG